MAASTKKALFSATILLLGPVAQSVEQRIENPCVGGSIPPQATKFISCSYWGFCAAGLLTIRL